MVLQHILKPGLAALTRIERVKGRPGDRYEVIFVDHHGQIVVPLTEWYRLRGAVGPTSTRDTYLTWLLPFMTFLLEQGCPWNAPPDRLRPLLIDFHRDRLGCLVRPGKLPESVEVVLTKETPVRESTLGVLRAALRDFYVVLRDAGLYPFPNPLSSEALTSLKREQTRALANRGAPPHAGIREESHAQSRRRPTAFLRHPEAKGWKPALRKELEDVRVGIHGVLDAMLDSKQVPIREKAVLHLLQTTGARLHEIILMTVGGYRSEGIAGLAQVVNKGSYGQETKTIYFEHNPEVQHALSAYLERERPLYDLAGNRRLAEVGGREPFFLTERGTPYSPKAFYYHWYKYYRPLQSRCPVRFSPHDVRHLFVTEYLIRLKLACGAGTEHFDAERYLREREAFGLQIMGWQSTKTIDIYDQTRDGEGALSVLAAYQKDLSQRRYVSASFPLPPKGSEQEAPSPLDRQPSSGDQEGATMWMHDAETLAWIKEMELQAKQQEKRRN